MEDGCRQVSRIFDSLDNGVDEGSLEISCEGIEVRLQQLRPFEIFVRGRRGLWVWEG